MRRAPTTLLFWLLVASSAGAAEAAVLTANLDRNEVQVGEHIVFTLTVKGSQSARFQPPTLPNFDVFDRGESTQMQVMNGKVSTSVTQTYVLVPKKVGKFTIGAARAQVGGTLYTSNPLKVRVLAAGAQPKRENRDLFLVAKVSNRRPYAGEFFLYTLRFYTRVRIAGGNIEEPELTAFIKQPAGEKEAYRATVRGVEYQVNEFKWALQAQQPGKIRIEPASVSAEVVMQNRRQGRRSLFDDFFDSPFRTQTEVRVVRSNAIDINVQPLPPAPSGFGGLIGKFSVQADLSQRELHVGESTTLTVRVTGQGNAAAIGEPEIRGLESFKVYDDKPGIAIETDQSGQHGTKTFKKALVPLREGKLTIPPIVVPFFDPNVGTYRRARAGPFTLQALPPTGKEELKLTEFVTSGGGKVAVRVLADDILPIHRRIDALDPHGLSSPGRWLFGGSLLTPALLCVGFIGFRRRRERYESDTSLRRQRSALKTARRAAREAKDPAAFSRVLRAYIGDKLNVEGGALTPVEAAAHLREAGVKPELAGEIETLLERCEAARYGGGSTELPDIHRLLKQLERQVKA